MSSNISRIWSQNFRTVQLGREGAAHPNNAFLIITRATRRHENSRLDSEIVAGSGCGCTQSYLRWSYDGAQHSTSPSEQ